MAAEIARPLRVIGSLANTVRRPTSRLAGVARSMAVFEYESMLRMVSYSHHRQSGHFMC